MATIICPYLGIEEDAETAVAFPSPRNRCFRSGSPAIVSTVQQDSFCLKDAHGQCPVYLLKQQLNPPSKLPMNKSFTRSAPVVAPAPPPPAKPVPPVRTQTTQPGAASKSTRKKPAPKPVSPRPASKPPVQLASKPAARPVLTQPVGEQPSKTRRMKDSIITGLMGGGIMAILLAAILILPAYGSRIFSSRPGEMAAVLSETPGQQAGVISQPSLVFAIASDTPAMTARLTRTLPAASATKKPTLKPTLKSTHTRAPTRRPSATEFYLAPPTITLLAPSCGVPYGWVIYIVQRGDTLTSLSQRTNTSVSQLQSANCMGYSTMLYTGMNFYVPYIPAPVVPTWPAPSSTPASTSTVSPSAAPSSTPVPALPSPTQPPPTKAPPTVEPSPVLPTAQPTTQPSLQPTSGPPAPDEPTSGEYGKGG